MREYINDYVSLSQFIIDMSLGMNRKKIGN